MCMKYRSILPIRASIRTVKSSGIVLHPHVRIGLRAARQCGQSLLRTFDRPPASRMGRRALHEYTLATNNYLFQNIQESIRNAFPDHNISQDPTELPEESSTTWLLQPLDGETNFLRSLQNYCAVIGIFEGRILQHSIVYDYLQDEEYYASRDETAMVNQNRLRVSRIEALSDAVIAYTDYSRSSALGDSGMQQVQTILNNAIKHVRVSGSMGLDVAQVARGRIDALVATVNPQDRVLQCTSLLIKEAGGFLTNIPQQKKTESVVVAANPRLNQTITAMIKTHLGSDVQRPSGQEGVSAQQVGDRN